MNEAETRAELIDPALKAAGWGVVEASRVRREVITLGRLQGAGVRAAQDIADHVLTCRNYKLAVIEAKRRELPDTEGVAPRIAGIRIWAALCRKLTDAGTAFAREDTSPVLYTGAEVSTASTRISLPRASASWKSKPSARSCKTMRRSSERDQGTGRDRAIRVRRTHVSLLLNVNLSRLVRGLRRFLV
jgi:type I restriction enzyme R subunit